MAATVWAVPVFGDVVTQEEPAETVRSVEDTEDTAPIKEEGVYRPGDEGYDELLEDSKGDPEFLKYYTIEDDGTIISKNLPKKTMMRSAALTKLTHQSRYKNVPQFDCIDISKYQEKPLQKTSIDWAKVKAAGYEYVIIRAGHTWSGKKTVTPNKDPLFEKNITGAHKAGLKIGVYYFSQATTEADAKTEAKAFAKWIAPYKSMITLPAVMDYETYGSSSSNRFTDSLAKKLGKTRLTNNAIAFCEIMKGSGYTPMVYANKSFLNTRINAKTLEKKGYKIWLAHYTKSTDYNTTDFQIWQYSDAGTVPGISGKVDMDVIYGLGKWVKEGSKYKLVYSDGTVAKNTWTAVNGYPCYVDSGGYRLTGMHVINGIRYVFSSSGLGLSGKWYTVSDKTYYTQSKGRVVTGYKKIGSYYYGFSSTGAQYKNVTAKIGKYKYKFLSNGKSVKYTAKLRYNVNSRKGPSTKYKKKGILKKNKYVTVVRTSGRWSQLSDGRWFMTKYRKNVSSYPKKGN